MKGLCGLVLMAAAVVVLPTSVLFAQSPGQQSSAASPQAGGSTGPAGAGAGSGGFRITENDFLLLDRDQDGVIELDEDFAGVPVLREQVAPQLQQLDRDGDGRVTREEFFGAAQAGASWRLRFAILLGIVAFGAFCLVVDSVLDKTRRVLLLPALGTLVVAGGLAVLLSPAFLHSLLGMLVPSVLIALGTLLIAVVLGKPTEETEVEFLPTLQQQQGKRYVIGKGGRLLGTKTTPSARPRRPVRRPRRPPT